MNQRSDYVKVYIQDESNGHLVPYEMARWLFDAVIHGCKPQPKTRQKEARKRARKK
jgi:hypothetical protein